MKDSRTELFWWIWVVRIGVLLLLLAFTLIGILFRNSIVGGYYELGVLALAVVFAYFAAAARLTILVRTRTIRTNPAAAKRRTLIMIAATFLLPASIVLIIAVVGQ